MMTTEGPWMLILLLFLWLAVGAAAEPGLTVTAVGDVRVTEQAMGRPEIQQIRLSGDIVFANFEGVLGEPAPDPWKFSIPRRAADLLKALGLNTLSLANNHSLDLGPGAYAETVEQLASKGFWVAARQGRGVTVPSPLRGRSVRVVGFSYCTENNVNNLRAIPAILGPRRNKEVVIVSAHMGGENHRAYWIDQGVEHFGDEPRGDVVRFSHGCIDAGADLVLGHGPHVPRGLELYKNKLIVYSLGNFLFDYPGAELSPRAPGYSISITLDECGDFLSARIDSYELRCGMPVPDPSGWSYAIIQDLTRRNLKQRALAFPGRGRVERVREGR